MKITKRTTFLACIAAVMAGVAAMVACGGGGEEGGGGGGGGAGGGGGGGDGAQDGGEAGTLGPDGAPVGSDGSPGDAESGPTPMEACRAYLTAICRRYIECGRPINCDDYLDYCPDYVFGSGSVRTVESVMACTDARRAQSCADILAGRTPDCASPGTRRGGEPCEFSAQCASDMCLASVGTCGYCATPSKDGGCGGDVVCALNDECVNGRCASITVPKALAPDAACSSSDAPSCPGDQPCTAATPGAANGTCQGAPAPGAACRFLLGSSTAVCASGESCLDAGAGQTRACAPPSGVGGPCGTNVGVWCKPGLACTGDRSGTCQTQVGLGQDCSFGVACTSDLYCAFTAEDVGTCKPRPTVGEECNTYKAGTGWYDVPCLEGSTCTGTGEQTDAGWMYRCYANAAHIGEPCDPPLHPCAGALLCGASKTCELTPCPADAGAK